MTVDCNVLGAQVGTETGIYLFCLARPHCLPDPAITGIEDGQPLRQWAFKNIVAVLAMSAIDDFCGPEADQRMQDIKWIGPRACRHEAVVEEVMRHSPVFPARFGTIFSSFDALAKLLEVHYDEISRFLDKAAGKEEWSVKGLLNRTQAKTSFLDRMLSREEEQLATLSPGKRYLRERQIKSNADGELNAWLTVVNQGIADDLFRRAYEFRERKVLPLDDEAINMVSNWAFWIARKDADYFRTRVDLENERNFGQGLSLQLSGPWPPYSFLPSLDMDNR